VREARYHTHAVDKAEQRNIARRSRWSEGGSHASVAVGVAVFGVGEQSQQLADGPLAQKGLGQRLVYLDSVAVAAPMFVLEDVSGFHQVGDDAECGALGDAEHGGDLPQAHARVVGDAQQRLSMVGQEAPRHETQFYVILRSMNLEIYC
jgi:hypothetical protein